MKKVISCFICMFYLTSCEKKCNIEFAGDQFRFADKLERDSSTYYLYTRTTGWHDKAVYFELYDKELTFGECRKPDLEPIFFTVYDDYPEMQYVQKLILQPDQPEKLKIIYTKDKGEGIANIYDVRFTR